MTITIIFKHIKKVVSNQNLGIADMTALYIPIFNANQLTF